MKCLFLYKAYNCLRIKNTQGYWEMGVKNTVAKIHRHLINLVAIRPGQWSWTQRPNIVKKSQRKITTVLIT